MIPGGEKPRAGRSARKGDDELLICRCGSSVFYEVRLGVRIKDGKPRGGYKALYCLHCNQRVI